MWKGHLTARRTWVKNQSGLLIRNHVSKKKVEEICKVLEEEKIPTQISMFSKNFLQKRNKINTKTNKMPEKNFRR